MKMNHRLHGNKPYSAVVVHSGPGIPGSAFTLARGLSRTIGTIEPFQSQISVFAQVDELYRQIGDVSQGPVFLFGHSWGAWISFLFSAKYPEKVRMLFLIGSGAFDEKYVPELTNRRLSRLNEEERKEYKRVVCELNRPGQTEKDKLLNRLGELTEKSDNYCIESIPDNDEQILKTDGQQYEVLWQEGACLRRDGYFLQVAKKVKCPAVVIHGKEDPTPIEGIVNPLKENISNLKCYTLDRCGHSPWKEKYCKEEFWQIVTEEMNCAKHHAD